MECLWQHRHILLQVFFCIGLLTGLRADSIEWRKSGEEIEISCSTDQQAQDGMYLYHSYMERREVFYLTPGLKCSPRVPFDRRVKISGPFTNCKATISNLTLQDTGHFWCQYLKYKGSEQIPSPSKSPSVLVVVDGVKTCPTVAPHEPQTPPTPQEEPLEMSTLLTVAIITACSLVLLVLIIMLIWVKRCCGENGNYKPRPQSGGGLPSHRSDSVYEQMRPQRAVSLSHSSHSSAQVLLNPAYASQGYPQSGR